MELEMITLSEASQTEKNKYHLIPLICGIQFFLMIQKNLFIKQKQIYRYQKQTYGYQRRNVWGWGDKSGAWDEHTYATVYKINNQQKHID